MVPKKISEQLQQKAKKRYHCRLDALLLSALSHCLKEQFGIGACPVYLESHGRRTLHEKVQTERTAGWFTAVYPLMLNYCEDLEEQVISCKEKLLSVPDEGTGYGLYARSMENG